MKVVQLKPEFTACTKCKHFRNLEPNSPRRDIWYNHLCQASPLPKILDPYGGKERSWSVNDFGQVIPTDRKFAYCRDVNTDGHCPRFER